ncbi:DHH family phosphoesterase [Clostridium thermarum]|uniref:DHH family phosphoesterase n=1 Tax=Clostridium thermarum TaxID=1716543 RepID=UPI0013D0C49E|nr:bifunctional oligoribonuclease/PAP phosphatase NrnA [Clostridium thermarum]
MFKEIIEQINKASNIAISFHVSPDGDSIGSALALMYGLRKLGKKVNILCKEAVPEILNFLPSVEEINKSDGTIDDDVDCLIVLDCGNVERINCHFKDIAPRKYVLVNMDHHLSNDFYGDVNYVDPSYSAVGEIIYLLLQEMGISIDTEIAKCLYTSIITDCGSFKFSNTTALTHKIAGDLITKNIDFSEIHRIIYENKKLALVKLTGRLIDSLYLACDDRVCIIEVSKALMKEYSVSTSEVSDLVSIGAEIRGVEVVVFIKENDDNYKVSLRSKTNFDVRKLAEDYGGGGHSKASGFTYSGSVEELKETLIQKIGDSLK